MLPQERIAELRRLLYDTLTPLIDRDYVLLELPYYSNVGDLLIWEGEEAFLRLLPYRCLARASFHTFGWPDLPADALILLQGGGNWAMSGPARKRPMRSAANWPGAIRTTRSLCSRKRYATGTMPNARQMRRCSALAAT